MNCQKTFKRLFKQKFIQTWLLSVCTVSLAMADDTEIYGTNGAENSSNYAQPNVMIIIDTSGSMRGEASYQVLEPYDNSATYSGSYSRIVQNLNYYNEWGFNRSKFTNSESNCSSELATLDNTGTVTAKFRQRSGSSWVPVAAGSGGGNYIQCSDDGWEYTLYSPNYANWFHSNNKVEDISTRMDVVKSTVSTLVNNLADINVGLMRFRSNGGSIDVPIGDIESTRSSIQSILASYSPGGGTPLTEVLHEAGLYFHGEEPKYGSQSVSASKDGDNYDSPITAQCQKNSIILFTDGEPSGDQGSNIIISGLINSLNPPEAAGLDDSCKYDPNDDDYDHTPLSGNCLDEMAYYLANKDATTEFINDQLVTTYTIGGFGLNSAVELLSSTASRGQGSFYAADNAEELGAVLADIFEDILSTNTTFTAPAVSVNAFNASEHRDELFYALFRPEDKTDWSGNLKKFRLSADGVVKDKNNANAINIESGYFKDESVGYWNATDPQVADGGIVDAGGFSNLLTASRTIYSDNGVGPLLTFRNATNASLLNMSGAEYDANDVNQLKDWIEGIDIAHTDYPDTKVSRNDVYDPLHSEPLVATYGGTDENPDSTIFFGTNQGFIHAVNANTGEELFSYMPKELQGIQKTLFENNLAANQRPYGMDGLITAWIKDVNKNGVIYDGNTLETDEHLYIYAGMRRGGRNYYALNVTDRDNPKLLFKIQGGTGSFPNLGQTWGRMTLAKVLYNGVQRQVAFIPGGYDTNQDTNTIRESDTVGNSIYMVDASDGTLLWHASDSNAHTIVPDMKNSIPGSISAIDINGDNNVDYFYVADTGGRLLRFDINAANTGASTFADGGVIAEISSDNSTADNRRFYSKPSVSIVKDKQKGDYLSIAIGTGHRAKPISNKAVQDRFYVFKDKNIKARLPSSFQFGVQESEETLFYDAYKRTQAGTNVRSGNPNPNLVYNATDLIDGVEPSTAMKNLMINGGGWYINLPSSGEKAFTQATAFSGAVLFTTFSPSGITLGCGADTGVARLYALDQRWASPAIDLDGDGDVDSNDGKITLAHAGIAPRPVVIYRPGGGKSIAIGTETIDDSRFEEQASSDDCTANGTCEEEVFKCEQNNCYVVPVYWRQNDEY